MEAARVAVAELLIDSKDGRFRRKDLLDLLGMVSGQVDGLLMRLTKEGFVDKLAPGLFCLHDPGAMAERLKAKEPPNPLDEITKKFLELPDLLQGMMEALIDIMVEPEKEIMNLIERRKTRSSTEIDQRTSND